MSNRTEGAFGSEFFNQRVPIATIKDVIEEKQRTEAENARTPAPRPELTDTNDKPRQTTEHDQMTGLVADASKTEPQEPTEEAKPVLPGDVVHWKMLPRAKDQALFLVQQGRPLAEVARTVGWTEGTCRSTFSLWKRNKQVAGKPSSPEPFLHEDRFKEIRKLFLIHRLNRVEIIEKYGYAGSCVDDAFYRLKAEKQIDGTARMPMLPGMFDQKLQKPKEEPKAEAPKAEAPKAETTRPPGTLNNGNRNGISSVPPRGHVTTEPLASDTKLSNKDIEEIEDMFLKQGYDRTKIVERKPKIARCVDWVFDRMRCAGRINGTPDHPIVPTKIPRPAYIVPDTKTPLREKVVLKDIDKTMGLFIKPLSNPVGVINTDLSPSSTESDGADVEIDHFFEKDNPTLEALPSIPTESPAPETDAAPAEHLPPGPPERVGKVKLSQESTDAATILKQLDLLLQSLAMGGAERFDIDLTVKGWNR